MINHYTNFTLTNDNPDQVIICAGTNDILHAKEHADPSIIANSIANIARECKGRGINYVHISSLMPACSMHFQNIFRSVNNILFTICREEGFIYIHHDNIYSRADLHWDRLHLNFNGTQKYIGNLLYNIESYNPYLYPHPPFYSGIISYN